MSCGDDSGPPPPPREKGTVSWPRGKEPATGGATGRGRSHTSALILGCLVVRLGCTHRCSRGSLGPTDRAPRTVTKGTGVGPSATLGLAPRQLPQLLPASGFFSAPRGFMDRLERMPLAVSLRLGVLCMLWLLRTHSKNLPEVASPWPELAHLNRRRARKCHLSPHLTLGPLFTCQRLSSPSADIHSAQGKYWAYTMPNPEIHHLRRCLFDN